MVKFIHTADWQIGMKAAHVGAVGQRVRSERLDAARRVIEAATSHRADFIVVAGDTIVSCAVALSVYCALIYRAHGGGDRMKIRIR